MQHSPLFVRSVEQENTQTNKQTIKQILIPIVASLKPYVTSEQGTVLL